MVLNRTLILFVGILCSAVAGAEGEDLSSSMYKLDLMQANGGNPEAQYSLGGRFEEGRGVARDVQRAFEWFQKAADQGYPPAQFKIGQMYETGRAVGKDERQALIWYTEAAERGYPEAVERLKAIVAEKQRAAEEKARQEAQARQRAADKARLAAAAEKARKAATEPKPAAKAAARPEIPDLRELVLASKWYEGNQPAPFLPSPLTNCLAAGGNEVVCFSQEMKRQLGGASLTFTAKATLSDFNSDGSFVLAYLFNVTDIEGAGSGIDPLGLQARTGWQEPGLRMQCRAEDRRRLRCRRDGAAALVFLAR